jgi:hypothetical protein
MDMEVDEEPKQNTTKAVVKEVVMKTGTLLGGKDNINM